MEQFLIEMRGFGAATTEALNALRAGRRRVNGQESIDANTLQ